MSTWLLAVAAAAGYLCGALSFTRLVTRRMAPGRDLDHMEIAVPGTQDSFKITHVGATTAAIALGPRVGCLVGVLDMLKVALPTLVFRLAFPDQLYFLVTALAGAAGHNWPLFNRFKGGRGISAVYGALLVIDPVTAVATGVLGSLVGLVARDFFVTFIAGILLVIPVLWWRIPDPAYLAYAVAVNVFYFVTLVPDLRQYIRLRRSGHVDRELALQATPMGRYMLKFINLVRPHGRS